jgi:hypothetical protein
MSGPRARSRLRHQAHTPAKDRRAPLRPEPQWSETGAFGDLRSILLHNIVETSTHAGQLDVVRELADGGQHIVL